MEPQLFNSPGPFFALAPLILMALLVGITANFLAKEKGREVWLWTTLGCISFVNFFFIWFFVGAANLKTERKLDELLKQHQSVS